MEIGDVVMFTSKADNNIAVFCYDRHISGVIVGQEYNRYMVKTAAFDTVYADKSHLIVIVSKKEIDLVNYGVM